MDIGPSGSGGMAMSACGRETTTISTNDIPAVVSALGKLPDNTVVDGEIVAFDEEGRPSFNALQNYGSAPAPVVYYVFDVLVLAGQDLRREPLQKRRRSSSRRCSRDSRSRCGTRHHSTRTCRFSSSP
jgi:ATP-dependent DNA ligase